MDILPTEPTAEVLSAEYSTLSYDDSAEYAELPAVREHGQSSLADRISRAKVYLISDAVAARTGKRKYEETDLEQEMEEDVSDPTLRDNAILLHGPPISHLPTENLFAYATHFDAHPIGLEWVDDTTCIPVFSTKAAARGAFRYLAKSHAEEPSDEGFITAKPIPIAFWPPEERINKSLGKGEGLKGAIRMRWALTVDVKKRGAKKESEFYKKYGTHAGKPEQEAAAEVRATKKRRGEEGDLNDAEERARLDEDLDAFLADGDPEPATSPPPPPSKMRSDNMGSGRSLLDRTSDLRYHPSSLESRLDGVGSRRGRYRGEGELDSGRGRRDIGDRQRGRPGRTQRPRVTQEDLDAELDAFLTSKD